jgi:hypothetical protein
VYSSSADGCTHPVAVEGVVVVVVVVVVVSITVQVNRTSDQTPDGKHVMVSMPDGVYPGSH